MANLLVASDQYNGLHTFHYNWNTICDIISVVILYGIAQTDVFG